MSKREPSDPPAEHIPSAYERMMERVKHALEDVDKRARPSLSHAIERARERAVALGELTREEAERVGEYLRRDMHHMSEYVGRTGKEYRSWFHMDRELIEARIFELMVGIADQTEVELARWAEQANTYHTGEIAAPGTLECHACGEHLKLTRAGHIPPCPRCHATEFARVTE